jgi:hypothetical protein
MSCCIALCRSWKHCSDCMMFATLVEEEVPIGQRVDPSDTVSPGHPIAHSGK